ncbi:hypothetical protein OH736_45340 (plasmid) [Streptomyces sp. NBC_01650]|uniref:hypothetical protein n=1 Tax=Streptomyces sp. NBC_01650 TaxID=2975907 RepID=UPI002F915B2C|nr:hypothetical protein OH736_45340 [Streptomyces sp. NBC_01650]
MTGAQFLVLAGAVFSGLLATALLCGEGRAVLAFLRAAWETAAIGVVLGVLTLLGGLDSPMASVVAVVLP